MKLQNKTLKTVCYFLCKVHCILWNDSSRLNILNFAINHKPKESSLTRQHSPMCALLQEYPCCDGASAFPQIDATQLQSRLTTGAGEREACNNGVLHLLFHHACTRYPQGQCTVRWQHRLLTTDFRSFAYGH